MSAVIFGGGEYGFTLAQMLEGGGQRVRLLERDPKLCRRLSESLRRTVVVQRDATSVQQLKEDQVGVAVVAESGKVAGQKVSEVRWPEGSVLVARLHGSEALVFSSFGLKQAGLFQTASRP